MTEDAGQAHSTAPRDTPASTRDIAHAIALAQQIPALVNADQNLRRRAAGTSMDWQLMVSDTVFHIQQRDGEITSFEQGPFLMRSRVFAISSGATAWFRFWHPVPDPGYHDILALSKHGVLSIDGELQPFMANLQVLKDILAKPREEFNRIAGASVTREPEA